MRHLKISQACFKKRFEGTIITIFLTEQRKVA